MNLSHLAGEKMQISWEMRRPRYNPYNSYKMNTPSRAIPASRGGGKTVKIVTDKTSPYPSGQRLLSFVLRYGILLLGVVDKRQAVCPSGPTLCGQGRFFALPTVRKGGLAMVTFSDLIQTGILIVGIIGLVLQIIEIERNHRQ